MKKEAALSFLAVLVLLSPGAGLAQSPPAKLQDRIVAVVNEDAILESEIDRAILLGFQQRREGENERAFRRRVLDSLIEDRLRLHEIDRFGFMQVAVEEIDKFVAEIRSRYATEEEYQAALREAGVSQRALRQLAARQLMTLTYVEERLGPRVFVSLEDITQYYRDVLTPEMQKRGQPVPPIEEVREQIRILLRERRLNEEIAQCTKTLRRNADVNVYFDRPLDRPLPPIVERVERGDTKKQ